MLNLQNPIFPVLNTQRLTLRRLVKTDAFLLHQLRSSEQVNRYLGRQPSANVEAALAFIQVIDNNIEAQNSLYWVITLTGEDDLIGTICLWNFDNDKHAVELGYELLPTSQGQGFMAEAAATIIKYGFKHLNAEAIIAYPSADNIPSIALLKRLNFVLDDMQDAKADNLLRYILKPLQ